MSQSSNFTDIFIIGGGVNGCGIARDAAGRGLSVRLAEQGDLAQGTSSASTKLFHGGLRYLEYYQFNLVRKSLKEREALLKLMPHISFPMRFVIPHHKGLRPRWLIRMGLFLYDHLTLGNQLPKCKSINLHKSKVGKLLQNQYAHGFEYSDCWVDDARLVVLNARSAADKGAHIMTHMQVIKAVRQEGQWHITCQNKHTKQTLEYQANRLVNAAGPWISNLLDDLNVPSQHHIRLVRGSHIVVPKLFNHDKAYLLQGQDGRVVFLLPFAGDYTLIGTTDVEHENAAEKPTCSDAEVDYLCQFVNDYIATPIDASQVIWRYSGVRPLLDDGSQSASAISRDYWLEIQLSDQDDCPLLNVWGGKITTYRKLAEEAMDELLDQGKANHWTHKEALPGGDFPITGRDQLVSQLMEAYPYLDLTWAQRLMNSYGTDAYKLLGDSQQKQSLGQYFAHGLTEAELQWMITHEYAQTVDDVIWRRSKLGLKLSKAEKDRIDQWMQNHTASNTDIHSPSTTAD